MRSAAVLLATLTASAAAAQEPVPEVEPPVAAAEVEPVPPPSATIESADALPAVPPPPPAQARDAELVPAAQVPVAPPASVLPDEARYTDAHATRVIGGSVARTHPRGTITFSDYDVLGLQLTYATGDRVELALSLVPALWEEGAVVADVMIKGVVLATERFGVALLGGVSGGTSLDTYDRKLLIVPRAGVAGTVCLDPRCASSLSLNVHVPVFLEEQPVVFYSLGAVVAVSSSASLLLEAGSLATFDADDGAGGIAAVGYGVRFAGSTWGLDFVLLRPWIGGWDEAVEETPILALGVPSLVFSFRTEPDA